MIWLGARRSFAVFGAPDVPQDPNPKIQTPSFEHQASGKLQAPNPQTMLRRLSAAGWTERIDAPGILRRSGLELEVWAFSGAWGLELDASDWRSANRQQRWTHPKPRSRRP